MSHRPRFTRVTVAIDSSPAAEEVIDRAAWLPLGPEAAISLVHAVPDSVPAAVRGAIVEEAAGRLRRITEDLEARVRLRAGDVTVDSSVVVGAPFVEIIRHARSRGAELVVVGRDDPRHRRLRVGAAPAERVVRKGDVPVLLARGHAEGPYRRALLAIDLSDASRRVGELALALLPDDAGALSVMHAIHVPFADWLAAETLETYRREHVENARTCIRRFAEMFEPFHVEFRAVVKEGDPRTAILREAVRTRSELIVLGTHGRSGVAHALLGSVAEWLLRAAHCDVAVTRPARFTFELP